MTLALFLFPMTIFLIHGNECVPLAGTNFYEVLSRGTVYFKILLKLFYSTKCTAFVCNWLLCRHLRSTSTLESLVDCYAFFCMFLSFLGSIIFKQVPSRGTLCFETLLKLFYILKCTAFVLIRATSRLVCSFVKPEGWSPTRWDLVGAARLPSYYCSLCCHLSSIWTIFIESWVAVCAQRESPFKS